MELKVNMLHGVVFKVSHKEEFGWNISNSRRQGFKLGFRAVFIWSSFKKCMDPYKSPFLYTLRAHLPRILVCGEIERVVITTFGEGGPASVDKGLPGVKHRLVNGDAVFIMTGV